MWGLYPALTASKYTGNHEANRRAEFRVEGSGIIEFRA